MKCHPDRSVAKWRDLLFTIHGIESEWERHPPLCHPDRSGGICSSADLSWGCFSTYQQKCHPGRSVAQWRDLLFVLVSTGANQENRNSPNTSRNPPAISPTVAPLSIASTMAGMTFADERACSLIRSTAIRKRTGSRRARNARTRSTCFLSQVSSILPAGRSGESGPAKRLTGFSGFMGYCFSPGPRLLLR
jgi:hypothetical protein